jgi:hypothetical protein
MILSFATGFIDGCSSISSTSSTDTSGSFGSGSTCFDFGSTIRTFSVFSESSLSVSLSKMDFSMSSESLEPNDSFASNETSSPSTLLL